MTNEIFFALASGIGSCQAIIYKFYSSLTWGPVGSTEFNIWALPPPPPPPPLNSNPVYIYIYIYILCACSHYHLSQNHCIIGCFPFKYNCAVLTFAPRSEVDEDNPEHEKFALQLRDQLLQKMEERAQELSSDDMFLTKLKLQETVQQFKVRTVTKTPSSPSCLVTAAWTSNRICCWATMSSLLIAASGFLYSRFMRLHFFTCGSPGNVGVHATSFISSSVVTQESLGFMQLHFFSCGYPGDFGVHATSFLHLSLSRRFWVCLGFKYLHFPVCCSQLGVARLTTL